MHNSGDGHIPQMLTVREAAQLLRVNVKTLYAEISCGRLPHVRFGRTLRIPGSVIASMLEQGRVAPPGGRNGGKGATVGDDGDTES